MDIDEAGNGKNKREKDFEKQQKAEEDGERKEENAGSTTKQENEEWELWRERWQMEWAK